MKTIYKVFGKTYPIASLTYSHIEQYKEYWYGKHKPSTININLSKIRAYHNWCVKKGYAKKIEFVLVKETPKEISYLTEDEFNGIMQLDVIDVHFRKAFLALLFRKSLYLSSQSYGWKVRIKCSINRSN